MKIPNNQQINGLPISSNSLTNIKNIFFNTKVNLHHSHLTGEIIGCAHGFCNRKVRENKHMISVFAYHLFGFDFFFLLKGIRLSVWKTTNLSISGSNVIKINYANISEKVKFIDTMKYYQQSLANLAESMTDQEIENIKSKSKKVHRKTLLFWTDI